MSGITVTLDRPERRYLPGEEVTGTVEWSLEADPSHLEVVLFWYTEGKGSSDSHTVASEIWEQPGAQGLRDLRFALPEAPHSFSGKLITLRWAVEVYCKKPKLVEHVEFEMSPAGAALILGEPEEDDTAVPEFVNRFKPKAR